MVIFGFHVEDFKHSFGLTETWFCIMPSTLESISYQHRLIGASVNMVPAELGTSVPSLHSAARVLHPVEILIDLVPSELGTSMPFQLSTAGVLDPVEILIELLPAGLGTSVPYLFTTAGNIDPGEKS